MSTRSGTPPRPAAYGRSCEECSRSKCKCLLRDDVDKCERCHRLNRECRPSASRRRRDVGRPRVLRAGKQVEDRTTRLEARLDDLVAALRSGTAQDLPERASGSGAPSVLQQPSPLSLHNSTSPSVRLDGCSASLDLWSAADIPPVEAEELLETFKTRFVTWFPMCYVPPNTTAAQLYAERPFLWLGIMAAASWHSNGRQKRLSDLMRRYAAEKMVMESEKSLDLLLGLLTFMTWYHFYSFCADGSIRTSLSLLMQLAISLVFDLNLHKPPPTHAWQNVLGDKPLLLALHGPQNTREETRAVLSCWFMTSITSAYLQRMDSLRWTSHLECRLNELERNPEWDGDLVLVYQVRMQLVAEKALLCSWYEAAMEPKDEAQVPYAHYFHILNSQLDGVKDNLPDALQNRKAVLLAHASARVALAEWTILQLNSHSHQASLLRAKTALTTITMIKTWFEIFLSIPISEYKGLPFCILSNVARALSSAFLWRTTPGFAVNTHQTAPQDFDIVHTLDRSVEILRQIGDEGRSQCAPGEIENIFEKHYRFYEAKRPGLVSRLNGLPDESLDFGANQDFMGADAGDIFDIFDIEWFMNQQN